MDRGSVHIVTVGTSILTNWSRAHGGTKPPAAKETLLEWVRESPEAASAELSAMMGYVRAGDVGEVHLVHTQGRGSGDGKRAAVILARYLREAHKLPVDLQPVPGLDWGEEAFVGGMFDLLGRVGRFALRRERAGQAIRCNVTGGYKAHQAMLSHIGFLMGWTVYYRHETMKRPVEIPPLLLLPPPNVLRLLDDLLAVDERMVSGATATGWTQLHGKALEDALGRRLVEVKRDRSKHVVRIALTPLGYMTVQAHYNRVEDYPR